MVEEVKREKLSTCIGRQLKSATNSEELMKKHLEFTGGKVMTRFPPQPNGYLHLGHAKAIRFNFQMAQQTGGHCYLRFDDTNPDKETEQFIVNIKNNVSWLGYEPWKVTFASDYFPQMYELAKQLIRKGKAYVDHQPQALIKEQRKACIDSPYRDTPSQQNLEKFQKMKKGFYAQGEAFLRMKIDMKSSNPCMRDPVAYRIKYTPHPHVGDQWCIYPTYDMQHCIVDSLENITHSLCTLEFEIRRDSYYWLVEALDLFRSSVWEYSRLNLTYTVMSKRKLQRLVQEKHVFGWDDPRMPTLVGIKRRGFTPESICQFVDLVGVTRRGNQNFISIKLLEHCVRKDLDGKAPRTMGVIDPLKIVVKNWTGDFVTTAPLFPITPEKGSYQVSVSDVLYIERSDFQEVDQPGFFGLALNKTVGVKYLPFKLRCTEVCKEGGQIVEIICEKVEDDVKPQAYIHWISSIDGVPCQVRLYQTLFKSENPNSVENFLDDINPDALIVKEGALVNRKLLENAGVEDRFQFERVGFFILDPDSTEEKKVFNRIITLSEGKKKKGNQNG